MNAPAPHRLDAALASANQTLVTLFARPMGTAAPANTSQTHAPPLSTTDTALSGALMRVNHVGEVCAQALYNSQALGARLFSANETLAQHFDAAGREEGNHLAWTRQRLDELGSRPSLLNPLWYAGAFGLGLLASRAGERTSLGFVVETERQVEAHLASHLARLPENDFASRAVVAQMKADEARHASEAQQAGAAELPALVKWAMKMAAKVMTTVAHRV
jgi:ubiquinone biosynthesis monooxygenase Coq7